MKTVAIAGASGYVGRNLVQALLEDGDCMVKVLSRSESVGILVDEKVQVVNGDLLSPSTLEGFLEPGCTVINLVYLWDAGERKNLQAVQNLADACKLAGVQRLVHVSTAAVVGRVTEDLVTELAPCRPVNEYGITKLSVEHRIQREGAGHYDFVIMRPTSVFGPGGEPLRKLAGDLRCGSRPMNYLKSCLFNKRRMNLVHVSNVVAAILFLSNWAGKFAGDVFIVSDDDSEANNFDYVESVLMRGLALQEYGFPRIPLPLWVLQLLLRLMGRNNVNPRCNYSGEKLRRLGFRHPVSFESGLSDYVAADPALRSS